MIQWSINNDFCLSLGTPEAFKNFLKMLRVHIDHKLSFSHIGHIYLSVSNQLNALTKLKRYLGNDERKLFANSFLYFMHL